MKRYMLPDSPTGEPLDPRLRLVGTFFDVEHIHDVPECYWQPIRVDALLFPEGQYSDAAVALGAIGPGWDVFLDQNLPDLDAFAESTVRYLLDRFPGRAGQLFVSEAPPDLVDLMPFRPVGWPGFLLDVGTKVWLRDRDTRKRVGTVAVCGWLLERPDTPEEHVHVQTLVGADAPDLGAETGNYFLACPNVHDLIPVVN